MDFLFKENNNIPKLSWSLEIEKNSSTIIINHGNWVETGTDFFIEGTWGDDFGEINFDKSISLMASGAVIKDKELIICTPCNTTECVYSSKKENKIIFSNSIPFLLSRIDDSLDINYLDYENDILSISDGLSNYKKQIPTSKKNGITLHYFNNVVIQSDLSWEEVKLPTPPEF